MNQEQINEIIACRPKGRTPKDPKLSHDHKDCYLRWLRACHAGDGIAEIKSSAFADLIQKRRGSTSVT